MLPAQHPKLGNRHINHTFFWPWLPFLQVNRATTFNGKSHIELPTPKNLEEIKAFTAVDMLMNIHQDNPSKVRHKRKRRHEKHKMANFFVFYLGNKNVSDLSVIYLSSIISGKLFWARESF